MIAASWKRQGSDPGYVEEIASGSCISNVSTYSILVICRSAFLRGLEDCKQAAIGTAPSASRSTWPSLRAGKHGKPRKESA